MKIKPIARLDGPGLRNPKILGTPVYKTQREKTATMREKHEKFCLSGDHRDNNNLHVAEIGAIGKCLHCRKKFADSRNL